MSTTAALTDAEIATAASQIGEADYLPPRGIESDPRYLPALRAELARRREVSTAADYRSRWVSPLISEIARADDE